MTSEDSARYLRAYLVISDVFANIMRKCVSANVMCKQSLKSMLQNKKFQKVLTKSEKAVIEEMVNTRHDDLHFVCENLDITISYKIVRFFQLIRAPSRGWSLIPTSTDQSVSDDIERIRISRNALLHKPRPELTEAEMESYFTDFTDMSRRFDSFFKRDSNNGYYKSVNDYRNKTIDPEMEEKYKKEIRRLEEKCTCSLSTSNQQKISIFFEKDINEVFSSDLPSEHPEYRMKIHLPSVIDSDKICKVLQSIIMQVVQKNFDIILDNVGIGSLVLFVTTKDKSMINEDAFIENLRQLVGHIIEEGKIKFQSAEKADVVVLMSDPLIDYDNHKVFDEFKDYNSLDSELLSQQESEEEKHLRERFEATLKIPDKPLTKNEVADIMNKALKRNEEVVSSELRLIMIGKTGVGKSALGNFICGGKYFKVDDGFRSCTDTCKRMTGIFDHRKVTLIDTPGLFNTERSQEYIEQEIRRCIGMVAPGPHAVLFVMSLRSRFKDEDINALKKFISFFGESMLEHVIVVFTHADKVDKSKLGEFLQSVPTKCEQLLQICGNRFVHVNCLAEDNERQKYLKDLYMTIDNLKLQKFVNGNLKRTEELVQVREKEIASKVQRQIEEKLLAMESEIIRKDLLRMVEVRDKVRSEIECNQAQFVINGNTMTFPSTP